MAANDKQVGGAHYAAPIQHWDIVVMHQLNYFESQITKYAMRARKKNGKQDIEKCIHFAEKYLEVYDQMVAPVMEHVQPPNPHAITQYADGDFSIEGYVTTGHALYKCRHCGQEGWAMTTQDAHTAHGECAARGYVAQG